MMPKAKTLVVLFSAGTVCLLASLQSCGLLDSKANSTAHITQITVQLSGLYASKESATVSIDGVVIGTVGPTDVVTKEVAAGDHDIAATNKDGRPAWVTGSVHVDSQQTVIYSLNCDPIAVFVATAIQCESVVKGTLRASIVPVGGSPVVSDQAVPLNGEYQFQVPAGEYYVSVVDDNTHRTFFSQGYQYLPYRSRIHADVTCQ
jgi:hypothetical protein